MYLTRNLTLLLSKKSQFRGLTFLKVAENKGFWAMAERVGFEPTVGLHLRLISSQVHSTTLPPLQMPLVVGKARRLAQAA